MKKVCLVVSIFCLLFCSSCSKKSENKIEEKDVSKGTEVVSSEEELESFVSNETSTSIESSGPTAIETKIADFDFDAEFEEASTTDVAVSEKSDSANTKKIAPPDPVGNLDVTFDWKSNKIVLSWVEPANPEFTYVEVKSNKSKEIVSIPKGITSYGFVPKDKDTHKFIVTSFNSEGMAGKGVRCSLKDPYLFESFEAPTVANTGAGKPVIATIKGINFNKFGITNSNFKASCSANPSITNNAKFDVLDKNTLMATLTIPAVSGNYDIVISCGEVKFTGKLNVLNYDKNAIGYIVKDGEEPVAVIAGYDSLGYPFGIGLKEGNSLKWALEGSFGCDTCFDEIVCQPSVVGVNSAIEATFAGDIDGYDNWDAVCKKDPKCKLSDGTYDYDYIKENYPIFNFALNYGKIAKLSEEYSEGWYIPSVSELSQIYANREKIEKGLSEAGGKRFKDDFYWSSTQNDYYPYNACAVKFVNGSIYKYYIKSNAVYARCIKMFK